MNNFFVKTLSRDDITKYFRNKNPYFINCKKVNRVELTTFVEFSHDQVKFDIWH